MQRHSFLRVKTVEFGVNLENENDTNLVSLLEREDPGLGQNYFKIRLHEDMNYDAS